MLPTKRPRGTITLLMILVAASLAAVMLVTDLMTVVLPSGLDPILSSSTTRAASSGNRHLSKNFSSNAVSEYTLGDGTPGNHLFTPLNDIPELTEGNAADWAAFASEGAATSVSNNSARVKVGSQSIYFATASGFDTGVMYPAAANAHWDLSNKNYLVFWAYASNNNFAQFQNNQPIIILNTTTGTVRYQATSIQMSNLQWRLYEIPLSGGTTWDKTTTGAPNLTDVNQIEIHQDTWDFGFTILYDGMEFLGQLADRTPDQVGDAAGDLDAGFGTAGIVTTPIAGSTAGANSVVALSDGKILAVGAISNGTQTDFLLARYNANGSLDSTFGTAGLVSTDFNSSLDVASDAAVQADNKIVVAGQSGSMFTLVRYNEDGSLDTSFGTSGKVSPFGGSARGVAIQPDGKIVAIGGDGGFALVRYYPDGSLDTSFDSDGIVFTNIGLPGEPDTGYGLVIQPDGKIVACGTGQRDFFALARFNPDGSLDTSFSGDGKVMVILNNQSRNAAYNVAVQSDGKIVAIGKTGVSTDEKGVLVRLNDNGSLDTTFNSSGVINIARPSRGRDIAIQPDGRIVAVTAENIRTNISGTRCIRDQDFVVYRFNTDGTPDIMFDSVGRVYTSFSSGPNFGGSCDQPYELSSSHDQPFAVALQSDGKIVAAGTDGSAFALARYLGGAAIPDLTVTAIVAPSSVDANTNFNLGWDDRNAGAVTANGPWKDKIFFSIDNQVGNDTFLGTLNFSGSLLHNQSVPRNLDVNIPANEISQDGNYYLIITTDADNNVIEGDAENNNSLVVPITVRLPRPDLQITASNAASQAVTDSAFEVSWTDKNLGTPTAGSPWTDTVYLSPDNQFGNDIPLASFPLTNSLEAGQSANRIQAVSIPRSAVSQTGDYFLIIKVDADNNVDEGGNENNNFVIRPLQVIKQPYPDLIVAPNSIVAPDSAFFDQTVRVQWTIKNIGGGPTNATDWNDWVYLSADNIPEIEDPYKAAVANVSFLNAGESYIASADIHIPRGLVGSYNITVWTDGDGTNHRGFVQRVLEEDESNNFGLVVRPIQINAAPEPDLRVISVAAPEETFTGGPISVNWRVENHGDRTTLADQSAWVDKIYLSQDQIFNPGVDREIGSKPHSGGLALSEGYNESATFNVPDDIAGPYYVFVVTDADDSIYEFSHEDNNSNYDRDQPGSPMQIRATPPDLIVPAIGAPNAGTAANQIAVTWTVRNQGAFDATPRWFDTVYLSSDQTLSPTTDIPLATVQRDGTLSAGAEYNSAANVTLPACLSGTYYLFVYTDSRNQIFEYDSQLNAEQNNYSQPSAVQINNLPPDLQVATVSNADTGIAGQPTLVSWRVINQGVGPTIATSWTDSLFLSQAATFSQNNALLLGRFAHGGTLAPNADYARSESVIIPTVAQGSYFLFVVTDANNTVEECADEGNNTAASPMQINISNTLPDLRVASIASVVPSVAGSTLTVQWTGQNNGGAGAQNQSWGDSVFFSTDDLLDTADQSIGSALVNGPLPAGATYQAQAQVQLPVVAPGNYFLLVVADNGNNVFEGQNENNNLTAIPLQLIVPMIDLVVSNVGAPATTYSGQNLNVTWTVTNVGVQPTISDAWTDYVFISRDQIFDSTDQTIGYLPHHGALQGAESYNAALDVFVPSGYAGPWYLFVMADRNNQTAESSESNNASAAYGVNLQLTPPADLVVDSVTAPATAEPGGTAVFQWTVQNIGANPALGLWTDSIYLSTDATWDIGDVLVGQETEVGPLNTGQSHNANLTATLPAMNPGQYFVIVRADIRNRVRESDESNNTGVSIAQVSLDVTELQLGVSRNTTLVTGQERFYRTNTPANETVRFSIDGPDGSSNELFTRFGSMVTRSQYDFLFSRPSEPDQRLVVPQTRAGAYYTMARAEYVPTDTPIASNGKNEKTSTPQASTIENVSIRAEVLPFGVSSVTPGKGGSGGNATVRIQGAQFRDFVRAPNSSFAGMEIRLTKGSAEILPIWAHVDSPSEVVLTFDLRDAQIGLYNVELRNYEYREMPDPSDGLLKSQLVLAGEAVYPNGFEVVSNRGSNLFYKLHLPSSARVGSKFGIPLEIRNDGTNDISTPLLQIDSPNGVKIATSLDNFDNASTEMQVMVVGKNRKELLSPGETAIVQLYALAPDAPTSEYLVNNLASDSNALINWDALQTYYKDRVFYDDWASQWAKFKSLTGNSSGSLYQAMRQVILESEESPEGNYFTGDQLIKKLFSKARYQSTHNSIFAREVRGNELNNNGLSLTKKLATRNKSILSMSPQGGDLLDCTFPSESQRIYDRAYVYNLTMRAVIGYYPLDYFPIIKPLWEDRYLLGVGGFYDASDSDDNDENDSPIISAAKYSPESQYWENQIHLQAAGKLEEKVKGLIAGGQGSGTFSLEELVGNKKYIPEYADELEGRPLLEAPVKWDFRTSSFGFLVGGQGRGGGQDGVPFIPDSRSATGIVLVTIERECGKVKKVNIKWDVWFHIQDTLDYCPGASVREELGNAVTGVGALKRLEVYGDFKDVFLNISYRKQSNNDLEELSKKKKDCESPNPPSCSGGGDNCAMCKRGTHTGGAGSCPPPPPGQEHRNERSQDPNDKTGPLGFGADRYVASQNLMPYTINFENVSTATAAAQRISIADPLNTNLDWRTLRLKEIGFGQYRITIPENRAFYQTRIQLGADLGNLLADVSAGIDIATGKVTWTLTAIDPATGEQPNSATLGLLPPNNAANDGQGFVTYTVQPKAGAPTGTIISNNATIIFDTEEPITTNTVTNTLDADSPSSTVNALQPAQTQTTFGISWSGGDPAGGSGLQSYDIWVSESGGPYQSFLSGTTDTSAQYTGQIGKQYHFYSIARDNAGNVEAAPSAPDAVTRVVPDGYSVWQGNAGTDWNTATNWIPEGVPSPATIAIIPDTGVANEPLLNSPAGVSGLRIETGRTLNLSGDLTVTASLTLSGGVIDTGSSTLVLGPNANVARTAGDVVGSLRKQFAGPAGFLFPVGTANGYSPLNALVTAGAGDLTVRAVQGVQKVLSANGQSNTSLQRYWTLSGSGITTDLTFNYLAGDVMGNEANYKIIRVSGSIPTAFANTSADTVNHRAMVTGVSSFSDWTLGIPSAPTAAPATISGQIRTAAGLAMDGVVIELNGGRSGRAITDANGNYRFVNLAVGAFYTVTPALVNFTFSPHDRSFSLIANNTDAVFTALPDQLQTANPLETPEYFVRQQYLDFLNREPDQSGLEYWAAQIRQCVPESNAVAGGPSPAECVRRRRIAVSNAFFFEQEFQRTGAFVYRLYKEVYGDTAPNHGYRPSYAQFMADRSRINANSDQLAQSLQDLANDFAQRPEFVAKYPAGLTAAQFVEALLAAIQAGSGVNLQSERAALISEFNASGRGGVLYRLADDNVQSPISNRDFLDAEYNRAFVLTEYFGYLRRDPDQSGYDFWLNVVNSFPLRDTRGQNSMVCAFITSAEYQQRFSSIIPRGNGECTPSLASSGSRIDQVPPGR
ncbi:MAG: Na-Ca exchanger/integrin-beta4 [Acidobacteria bacterium]|nr:Na-Ca exchanger/integrin-beta4 [Acidobacteriota bacterium]